MPVKYFVSQDSQGREQAPNYSYETLAVIDIIKRVYEKFNHHPNLYAVIANLDKRDAYADLVVITERGLGVIELKHYYGRVAQKGPTWYAGSTPIKAGSERTLARNPHEQVQTYAGTIRDKLMDAPLRAEPWLPGRISDWQTFMFSTAVCFTHPQVEIEVFKQQYRSRETEKPWERFNILKPNEVPDWVTALRFEVSQDHIRHFAPHRLSAKQIMRITTQLLGAVEWTEIVNLMPTGEPYAYLLLKPDNAVFSLTDDEVIIGRDPTVCQVTLPKPPFERVSRKHAKITRGIDSVIIEDLGSTNGTYLNGKRLDQPCLLRLGQLIGLGGAHPNEKVCLLEFSFEPTIPSVTELNTLF